jgi:hypothetical protein
MRRLVEMQSTSRFSWALFQRFHCRLVRLGYLAFTQTTRVQIPAMESFSVSLFFCVFSSLFTYVFYSGPPFFTLHSLAHYRLNAQLLQPAFFFLVTVHVRFYSSSPLSFLPCIGWRTGLFQCTVTAASVDEQKVWHLKRRG